MGTHDAVSTEFYYFLHFGVEQLINQYYWLKADLKQVYTNLLFIILLLFEVGRYSETMNINLISA